MRRLALACLIVVGGCRCNKGSEGGEPTTERDGASEPAVTETKENAGAGLSAPIAAVHVGGGQIVVAGLDVPTKTIRVEKIETKGGGSVVTSVRTAIEDVKWSSEAKLEMAAAPTGGGVAITWRGQRGGKLGRALVVLGADLAAKGPPVEVAGPSCSTKDALWFTDGKRAHGRAWAGGVVDIDLPREKEPSILCGSTKAFAFLEEEDGTSFLPLTKDAKPTQMFDEKHFGDDEQRERGEYTVGDDLGVVRVAVSGALAMREMSVKDGVLGPVKKLRTGVPKDDDVVAVDASPKVVVVFYTEEVPQPCGATKVMAIRVDRASGDETAIELSKGECAREVGPFFTGILGDAVSVSWVERTPVAGMPKASIVALAHGRVPATGAVDAAKRIDLAADAVADAGCDSEQCYAAALERTPGTDGMVPGPIRVFRY